MRSIERGEEPKSLKENKINWTKDLIDEIGRVGSMSKVKASIKEKYKYEDIIEALRKMYGKYCCFCEGNVVLTGYVEVEHYKPKSKYPEECFNWGNLHFICGKCNKLKNDKWDQCYPVLDPTNDIIEDHLYFDKNIMIYDAKKKRSENTVNTLKLNRSALLEYRSNLYRKVIKWKNGSKETKDAIKEIIYTSGDYSTYKAYLMEVLYND